MEDIKHLLDSSYFQRYYNRRLEERRAVIIKQFLYGTPDEVDAAEREILRRLALEYDDILTMPKREFSTAGDFLSQNPAPITAANAGTAGNG